MAALNETFTLSSSPAIKTLEPKGFSAERAFVFESGSEILTLFQFCIEQQKKPLLVIECRRGEGKGPYLYEGATIDSLCHDIQEGKVRVNTNLGQILLFPEKNEDPGGQVITNVQVWPSHFPLQQYLEFRERQFRQQENLKPQP